MSPKYRDKTIKKIRYGSVLYDIITQDDDLSYPINLMTTMDDSKVIQYIDCMMSGLHDFQLKICSLMGGNSMYPCLRNFRDFLGYFDIRFLDMGILQEI